MNVWYIREVETKKIFKKIKINEIDNKVICEIPIYKKAKKTKQKLKKVLKKYNVKNVVLSDYLSSIEGLELNIIDGRKLFNYMIIDVIKYIIKNTKQELETQEVSILINNKTDINLKNIILICNNVKSVNIVTEKQEQFKELEQYIYENIGMMIKISNNTRKAMGKAKIIINLDFDAKMINKYIVPRNSIIININGKIEGLKKQFNGINVQYFEIAIPEKYEQDLKKYGVWGLYSNASLCESMINLKDNFENIRKKLAVEEIMIDKLIGINGVLQESEYKILDK